MGGSGRSLFQRYGSTICMRGVSSKHRLAQCNQQIATVEASQNRTLLKHSQIKDILSNAIYTEQVGRYSEWLRMKSHSWLRRDFCLYHHAQPKDTACSLNSFY